MRQVQRLGVALCLLIVGECWGHADPKDPPQHFVVVILTTRVPDFDPQGLGTQEMAEKCVVDLLFEPGKVLPGRPWYQFGRDYVTIVESGTGLKAGDAGLATKGNWKPVEFDYARPITRPAIRVRKARFAELLYPSDRKHVIDPEYVLDAAHSLWSPNAHRGAVTHLVMLQQHPVSPEKPTKIVADHLLEEGRSFRLVNQKTVADFPYFKDFGFRVDTADAIETPRGASGGGPSVAPQSARHGATWPRELIDAIAMFGSITLVGWAARWAYLQDRFARHFELWLPGFAGSFAIAPISQNPDVESRARLPRYGGEPAAALQVPHRFIRLLFYRSARLQWDPMVRVAGLPREETTALLREMPRFVRFLWVERPLDQGTFEISIERRSMLGGNERIKIAVSFFALPSAAQGIAASHDHEHPV